MQIFFENTELVIMFKNFLMYVQYEKLNDISFPYKLREFGGNSGSRSCRLRNSEQGETDLLQDRPSGQNQSKENNSQPD